MKPLVRGEETYLIEIRASWCIDDVPSTMFIKSSPNWHGFVNPRDIEELWRDQVDWVYREMDSAVYPMTLHLGVSGRPKVLLMLERLFDHFASHPGAEFSYMKDLALDFKQRYPRNA